MEQILNKLGLGILRERFEAERVEPEVVACLSDGNLASLGVSTIGDHIRLRELQFSHISDCVKFNRLKISVLEFTMKGC